MARGDDQTDAQVGVMECCNIVVGLVVPHVLLTFTLTTWNIQGQKRAAEDDGAAASSSGGVDLDDGSYPLQERVVKVRMSYIVPTFRFEDEGYHAVLGAMEWSSFRSRHADPQLRGHALLA